MSDYEKTNEAFVKAQVNAMETEREFLCMALTEETEKDVLFLYARKYREAEAERLLILDALMEQTP